MTPARSRTNGTVRYQALYVTLPIANGALLAACYVALYGLLGVPGSWITTSPGADASLLQAVGPIALWLIGFMTAMTIICGVDLLALNKVYGVNLLPFAKKLWRIPRSDLTTDFAVMVAAILTSVGSAIVVIGVHGFSTLPVPSSPSIAALVCTPMIVGAALARAYLPALTHGEEWLSAAR